jgi:hypothetical protein
MLATSRPLPIPEALFHKIENASQWVCPTDRDEFFACVAEELRGRELGEGSVTRGIVAAFKRFYRPIELAEGPRPRAYFKRAD